MASRKVYFNNPAGLRLVGVFHKPFDPTTKTAILCHGFRGDKSEHRAFEELAEALKEQGIAALRFDFSGSGESDPTDITLAKQVEDVKTAIAYCQQEGYTSLGLFGHSLGGLCALVAWDPRIKTMILHASNTKSTESYSLSTEKAKASFEKRGYAIVENSSGGKMRVDKQMVGELASIDQREILSRITSPLLFIHGSSDETNDPDHSKSAFPLAPQGSQLEIVSGMGHQMRDHLENTISLSVDWFTKHL